MNEEHTPILRTARHGAWEVYKGAWGSYLRQCSDPEANITITEEQLEHFEIRDDIHRIPADLWTRWVKLCFHFVDKVPSQLEVSIRFLRNATDPSVYRAVVPKQNVTMASVRADNFDECIDIVSGEKFTSYPPEGWTPVGSSHSHNTMPAFFSDTDDKYELDDPGIHLTVGKIDSKIMKYEIAASVVGSRRRFIVHYDSLIDATPVADVTFHGDVLSYVDYTTPAKYRAPRPATSNIIKKLPPFNNQKTYESIDEYFYDRYGLHEEDYGWESWNQKYNDPFYYNDGVIDISGTSNDVPDSICDGYQIIDLLEDYLKEKRNDSDALEEMKQQLAAVLISIELELSQ